VHAHVEDLRAEVQDLPEGEREALLIAVSTDWRTAKLATVDGALCAYAEKLTLHPATMSAEDVESLREAGLDDVAIHDAIQVIGYFNYINRIADAVHVDLEPEMPPYPEG
jgi:uncharacterized peroxidase-related enzyme